MPTFNKTLKEAKEEADKQTAKSMQLETTLERDLNKFWFQLSEEFKINYAVSGNILNLQPFQVELESLLKKNYRPTADWFSKVIKRELKEDEQTELIKVVKKERNQLDEEILLLLLLLISRRAQTASQQILTTTNNVIIKNVDKVIVDAAADGLSLTNKEIANKSSKLILEENRNRTQGIAQTEIGTIASEAKFTEAEQVQDNILIPQAILEKIWITQGDEAVRQSHVEANGQKRELKQTFLVQGEELMFPRDPSGSASNVIRCRCESVTT